MNQPNPTRERVVLIIAAAVVVVCAMALGGLVSLRTEQRDTAQHEQAETAERAETAEQYAAEVAARCKLATEDGAALRAQGLCPTAQKIAEKAAADPVFIPGTPGQPGQDGTDGKAGKDGKDGQPGTDGRDGERGPGIKSTTINAGGELVLTYDDGVVVNAGRVVGQDGKDAPVPDLSGYATEEWVTALIRALGCQTTIAPDSPGPPIVLACEVTGKP